MELFIASLQRPNLRITQLLLPSRLINYIHILRYQLIIIPMSSIRLIRMPISPSKLRYEHNSWLMLEDLVGLAVPFLMADLWLPQHLVDLIHLTRLPQRISRRQHLMQI
jgi:hypothetical protein